MDKLNAIDSMEKIKLWSLEKEIKENQR